jgi:hypothetical protein
VARTKLQRINNCERPLSPLLPISSRADFAAAATAFNTPRHPSVEGRIAVAVGASLGQTKKMAKLSTDNAVRPGLNIVVDLPPIDTQRWAPQRKALVVDAVRSGVISREEAWKARSNPASARGPFPLTLLLRRVPLTWQE